MSEYIVEKEGKFDTVVFQTSSGKKIRFSVRKSDECGNIRTNAEVCVLKKGHKGKHYCSRLIDCYWDNKEKVLGGKP